MYYPNTSPKKSLSMTHSDSKLRALKIQSHHDFPPINRIHSKSKFSLYDTEEQSDQILHLKKELNHFRYENQQLKVHNQYLQREMDQLQDSKPDEEARLMKSQIKIKSLMRTISQKDGEIDSIKKKAKQVDYIQQLENENIRLKGLCQMQNKRLIPEGDECSLRVLNELEQDNIKMVEILKVYEEKIKELTNQKKNLTIYQTKINSQNKLIQQLTNEIRTFKERDLLYQSKYHQRSRDQTYINKQNEEINKLSQKLQDNQEEINQLMAQHRDQIKKLETQLMEKDEEIMTIKMKCESLQKALYEEYARVAQLRKKQEKTLQNKSSLSIYQNTNKSIQDQAPLSSQRSLRPIQNINKSDLQDVQKILKYSMINNQLTIDVLFNSLLQDEDQNEFGYEQLYQKFKNGYFLLNDRQANQLASYFLDSDDDQELVQNKQRVKSILRAFLDNYQVPQIEEQQQIQEYLKTQLENAKDTIFNHLKSKHTLSNIFQIPDLYEALQVSDIKLTKIMSEYLEATLFRLNGNKINIFDISTLNEI